MADKNPDSKLEETIDDLAEKVKRATETITAKAHQLAGAASAEARVLAQKTSDKLREASEKLKQAADKLKSSSGG